MYGGFNGFPQRKIEDVSLGMMRKLTFKDSAWQMFWLISPLAPNTCKVTLTVDGTGNSEDFFVKLMKELKGKLKL